MIVDVPLAGRSVADLHKQLKEAGYAWTVDYVLAPDFHARLREGVACLRFKSPKTAEELSGLIYLFDGDFSP